MTRFVLVFPVAVLAACSGGSSDGDGNTDGGTTTADPFAAHVYVTEPIKGDFTCFQPAEDAASATWLTSTPDPVKQVDQTINGLVEDFEKGYAVDNATTELWAADDIAGAPDVTVVSDANGAVSFSAPVCTPMTYEVTTAVDDPDPTVTTYKAHQIYEFSDTATVEDASFVSVAKVTKDLILNLLGIFEDEGTGQIAGVAYDCLRDPAMLTDDPTGKIQNAQIVVYDKDGNIPEALSTNYFIEEFPARDQKFTSEDGLFLAANVPAGEATVELWGNVDGTLMLLGSTVVTVEAASINIANVYAGYGDGVKYPATCELAR